MESYEAGVSALSPPTGPSLRAGLELWLRDWLAQIESCPPIVIPGVLVGLMVIWTLWKWYDRPDRVAIPVFGIAFEGIIFGFGLWALCINAPFLLEQSGLSFAAVGNLDPRVVTFLGVGIYEEAIFRLICFAWLARLLNLIFIPWLAAIPVAAAGSAAVFALAHHLVQGDPFVPSVFTLRMIVGVFCALLFWLRGFGVAVGAHFVYDLIVGLPRS